VLSGFLFGFPRPSIFPIIQVEIKYRLEDGDFFAERFSGHNTSSANKAHGQVGHYVSVKIREDHNVELLWFGDELHAAIVDNHIVEFDRRIHLGHLTTRLQKQAIAEFPVEVKIAKLKSP
jgi:hypothetical protein